MVFASHSIYCVFYVLPILHFEFTLNKISNIDELNGTDLIFVGNSIQLVVIDRVASFILEILILFLSFGVQWMC